MTLGTNPISPSGAPTALGSRAFGKFRLLANLGAGGMGEVFLAVSRSSVGGVNKLVVIKRLRDFSEDDLRAEARQMFLNEARLATQLNHPNIVQTNDVGVEGEHMYLTMEYLEGQPLNAIVRAAKAKGVRLEEAMVLKIVSDALVGLHYAHELKDLGGTPLCIVHRDLSPHNLFVTYEGLVKVVDFGIAKSSSSARTEQGAIKGKFSYMAPEQTATEERIDRRADLFVMGIVLWELLTGERLLSSSNDIDNINQLLNDPFPAPSTVRPEIPAELDVIVMKAIAKDPEGRFQSAREMRDAIGDYLVSRSYSVRPEQLGPFVSELFANEQKIIKERIKQYLSRPHDHDAVDDLPALSAGQLMPSSSQRRILDSHDGLTRTRSASGFWNTPRKVAAGAILASLGALSLYGLSHRPAPAREERSLGAAPSKPAPPAVTLPAPAPPPASATPPALEADAVPLEAPRPSGSPSPARAPRPPSPPPVRAPTEPRPSGSASASAAVSAPSAPPPAPTPTPPRSRVFNTTL